MYRDIFLSVLFVVFFVPNALAGTQKCNAGEYMTPAGYCEKCLDGWGVYCEGGTFKDDSGQLLGLKLCVKQLAGETVEAKDAKKVSTDMKKCETVTNDEDLITCKPGQFLPEHKKDCIDCYGINSDNSYKVETAIQTLKKRADRFKKSDDKTLQKLYEYVNKLDVNTVYCPGGNFVSLKMLPSGLYYCAEGHSADFSKCGVTASESGTDIHCNPGYYSSAAAKDNNACTTKCNAGYSRAQGAYCPGGDYKKTPGVESGVKKCKEDQIVDDSMTSCTTCKSGKHKSYTECTELTDNDTIVTNLANRKNLSCPESYYMITREDYIRALENASKQHSSWSTSESLEEVPYCLPCFKWHEYPWYNYRCPGVPSTYLKTYEQGKIDCTNGQVTTKESPSKCIEAPKETEKEKEPEKENKDKEYKCEKGKVYTDGACTACISKDELLNYARENRMYCPGINIVSATEPKLKDQIKTCPKGAFPKNDLTDCACAYGLTKQLGRCVGELSYEDMYYGPEGKNAPLFKQCWTKTYAKSYKKCMGFDD